MYFDLNHNEALDLLRKWRENNERRSQDVMEIWLDVLYKSEKLGKEKHLVLEQLIYAALDCHFYGVAYFCYNILSKEFPGSLRLMKHKAAILEAKGEYSEALEVLESILSVDETNAPARKRRISLLKAQGQITEAIKELVDYLKKFMSDVEAWQELCLLYQSVQEYGRAAFCAEELLLHQPHNHLMLQQLADIRYTMGGIENLETAKSYYSQALKLNPNNMRALLGLFLATNSLLSHYKSSGNSSKRKEAWKLCQHAQAQLSHRPRQSLDKMMLALAITE